MMPSVSNPSDNAGFPDGTDPADVPPTPHPAFRWERESWGYLLRCTPLEPVAKHLFTSRQLALPAPGTDRHDRWAEVAGRLGVVPSRLMRVRQVHGRAIRVVGRGDAAAASAVERPEADALVSDVPGLALLVQVADCVPILMADPHAGAAAAVHAGWRGVCAGIATATVEAMVREFGCRPSNLVAALGPSIGPDDYEVGEALVEAFIAAGHADRVDGWFGRSGRDGAWRLNLWRAVRDQLTQAGVPAGAVHAAGLSTKPHPRWLESFRRDGSNAGRMAAIVVVPAPRR